MGLCVVGPGGLMGPLSGEPVGLVDPWIWWAVGLVVGPQIWWACGSGGFCGVLTDKSPTLRGPTCQGALGLVVIKDKIADADWMISLQTRSSAMVTESTGGRVAWNLCQC